MIAIADVAVSVSDARAAALWWRTKVGFPTRALPGAPHALLVAPPGERFLLHLCEGFEPVEPGNTGIAFMTDEMESVVARMVAAGVDFPEPFRSGSDRQFAKFSDPDGNVFWLVGAPTAFVRLAAAMKAPTTRRRRARPRPATPPTRRRRAARRR